MYYNKIKELIYKFQDLGIENSRDGAVLIGRAPHIAPRAWLNTMFPALKENEVEILEEQLKTNIPNDYKDFLLNFSNGLNILTSTLSLDGFRWHLNRDADFRQPYSIVTTNVFERPDNAKDSYFFIGGYNWDGSHLYIDKKTNTVHCCERWDATSKIQWAFLDEMLLSELKRLYQMFDDEGRDLDENKQTIPY